MHFPDTDPAWKGASSDRFVRHALTLVRQQGYRLSNVDSTVILERPKLKDYRPTIRASLAALVELPLDRVNVKFKTSEKVGPVGGAALGRSPSDCHYLAR
jgi:2-C-methyl-D-erythritol 2,4-cyclodiphosphate synthase